jgi:hypothetical protein
MPKADERGFEGEGGYLLQKRRGEMFVNDDGVMCVGFS